LLDPKYERCVSSYLYNKVAGIEQNLPRASAIISGSPETEKFVIQKSEIKKISLPGVNNIEEQAENFNVDDEEQ
jgi:hypothetical protein